MALRLKASPIPKPVDEAVHRQPGRSERAYLCVGLGLLGLVAVMKNDEALGQEEEEEADADERRHEVGVVHRVDRLGQNVEERDRDHYSAGERDDRAHLLSIAQSDGAAEKSRDGRQCRQRNCHPGDRGEMEIEEGRNHVKRSGIIEMRMILVITSAIVCSA